MEKIVVQEIVKVSGDVAGMYFRMISAMNDLALTEKDVQVLGFVAVHGNISEKPLRNKFCEDYCTTMDTINNVVYKLKKMGMVMKENGVIRLSPVFSFDYGKDLRLQIVLKHEQ